VPGAFTYGKLITFMNYLGMMQGPMQFFSHIFRWWSGSMNAAQRIFEIIDAKPDVVEKENPEYLDIKGDIVLKDVCFGYEPNKSVLKNIGFSVKAGEMLGIVGKSGAGKSTLVNLISRLYDVESGEITLDGVNIKDIAFSSLRGAVAMVSQETYIFMGTIAENIAYAKPDASRMEIVRAAMAANAHQFICRLPDGYDTIIGSGGRELSGGERQRLSIARAILANPRILVLDEATASVDTETERAIQESLEKLIKGRTTISIAHRLSTLRDADYLIVLDRGELVESGTHSELVAKRGEYYKLLQLQSKALAMRGVGD
jgi:ATP-binding cassette subfamily B protein